MRGRRPKPARKPGGGLAGPVAGAEPPAGDGRRPPTYGLVVDPLGTVVLRPGVPGWCLGVQLAAAVTDGDRVELTLKDLHAPQTRTRRWVTVGETFEFAGLTLTVADIGPRDVAVRVDGCGRPEARCSIPPTAG